MSSTKSLSRVEIKDADRGEFACVFATLNVVDSDRDVTLPGAFEDGAKVAVSAWGHQSWGGKLPVGVATIRETPREAIAEGQFFMDIPEAVHTFKAVKRLHEAGLGQWSYGYDPLKHSFGDFEGQRVRFLERQLVHEISPLLQGAGVGTRTVAAKGAKSGSGSERLAVSYNAAIRPHETDVEVKGWNPAGVLAGLDGASVSDLRAVHAWVDPGADPETKAAYRFPHHRGPGGSANVRAVVAAIAALNSGRAGIPDADVKGVYDHLAAHLRDADREPPDLKSAGAGGSQVREGALFPYDPGFQVLNQIDEAMAVVFDTIVSASRVGALRAAKGKGFSRAVTERLEWLSDDVRHLVSLLTNTDDEAAREYVRFVSLQQQGESR